MDECVCTDDPASNPARCTAHRFLVPLMDTVSKLPGVERLGDEGCSRVAFLSRSGRVVYKVPRSKRGLDDNHWETWVWQNRHVATTRFDEPIGPFIARCSLAPSGVLVMEYLDASNELQPAEGSSRRPSYLALLDDGQGGMSKDGRFLLYDYAIGSKVGDKLRTYWLRT